MLQVKKKRKLRNTIKKGKTNKNIKDAHKKINEWITEREQSKLFVWLLKY